MLTVKCIRSLLLVACLCCVGRLSAQSISVCRLQVPEPISRGSASFTDVFGFTVDSNGKPTEIRPISAPYVSSTEAISCIAAWRLPMSKGEKLVASLSWKHGMGWSSLSISGRGIRLVVELQPAVSSSASLQ